MIVVSFFYVFAGLNKLVYDQYKIKSKKKGKTYSKEDKRMLFIKIDSNANDINSFPILFQFF